MDRVVCQGFSYGSDSTFVTFKGSDDALNMAVNACNSPNNTFWALNAVLINLTEADARPIAMPPSPPHPRPSPALPPPTPPPPPNTSTNSKLGTAWGVVAAVVGPSIAVGTWFLLTWYCCSEKKIIINEVIRRLNVSDICKVGSAVQYTSAGASSAYQARQAKRSSSFQSEDIERGPALVADMVTSGSFTSAMSVA